MVPTSPPSPASLSLCFKIFWLAWWAMEISSGASFRSHSPGTCTAPWVQGEEEEEDEEREEREEEEEKA